MLLLLNPLTDDNAAHRGATVLTDRATTVGRATARAIVKACLAIRADIMSGVVMDKAWIEQRLIWILV